MKKYPCIYIVTNKYNTTLYIGVTSNLLKRIWEHKNKLVEGFTNKYDLDKLIYYEFFEVMTDAIKREKQLKGWTRSKKDVLISKLNLKWEDLYNSLI